MEWISVKEQQPKEYKRYLCMMFNKNCFIQEVCLYNPDTKRFYFEHNAVTVSHWQELPDPPKN